MKAGDEIWITRWALSVGIVRDIVYSDQRDKYVIAKKRGGVYTPGVDVFASIEAAKMAAEGLREKRKASLLGQLAKLEKIQIKVVEP